MSSRGSPSECITLHPSERSESDSLQPRWQRSDGDVDVSTGNAACGRGGRTGFIFTPACFITSEAFLHRLMKGKAAKADGSLYRLPASVPPDSGNQTTASEIYIPQMHLIKFCLSPVPPSDVGVVVFLMLPYCDNCLSND